MKRYHKIIAWGIGVVVLFGLFQLPLQYVIPNYKAIPQPLAGQTIVLDPGHGGADGGAKGKNGVDEKEVTLKVAKLLKEKLEQAGALVYLTREEDMDLAEKDTKGLSRRKSEDIRKRLEFIHDKDANFFLSIHLNAISDGRWSGAQTFYYNRFDENEHLAQMIQSELIRNLDNTDRTPLPLNTVYLLKYAEVPGSLVELGFLSNEKERKLLENSSYQRKLATSIYQGMIRYVMEDMDAS
ncbi:MAG TPA: N-acetylmuramoyl-L-alanine amidase CwlD [Pseudogracilibacillus sp.]|nr:N-acetylmuramoyl-L-alanine amidase CwlD [Pseudogracilibacillus sp.]